MPKSKKRSNEVFGINIRLSFTTGIIAFIVYLIAICLFIFTDIDKETIKFVTSSVTIITVITSAFYLGENFRQNTTSKEEDRAITCIATWTSPQFAEVRKCVIEIKRAIENKPKDQESRIIRDLVDNDKNLEEDIITILNFLEAVATFVELGAVDEEIIKDYFKIIFKRYCFIFSIWIEEQRRIRGDELYINLTTVNKRYNPVNNQGNL